MSNEAAAQMTRAFDELAGPYDHEHHDAVARALLEFLGSPLDGRAADVACGSGAAAFAQLVAADLPMPADAPEASRLAADAGFIDARARIAAVGSREVALVTGISR